MKVEFISVSLCCSYAVFCIWSRWVTSVESLCGHWLGSSWSRGLRSHTATCHNYNFLPVWLILQSYPISSNIMDIVPPSLTSDTGVIDLPWNGSKLWLAFIKNVLFLIFGHKELLINVDHIGQWLFCLTNHVIAHHTPTIQSYTSFCHTGRK